MDAHFASRCHLVLLFFAFTLTPIICDTSWLELNDPCHLDGSKGYCGPLNSACRRVPGDVPRCECDEDYTASSEGPKAQCFRNAKGLDDVCEIDPQCYQYYGHEGSRCGTNYRCECKVEDGWTLISSLRGEHECVQPKQLDERCRYDEECQFGRHNRNHFCDRNGTEPGVCAVGSGTRESSSNVIVITAVTAGIVIVLCGIAVALAFLYFRRRYTQVANPPQAEPVPNAAAGVNLEEGLAAANLVPEKPRARLTSWP